MSNHSQIMEAGPSIPIVVFRISHGAIRREQIVRHPERLRRCSLGLRRLMDNQVTNVILLELDPTSCIDCTAAAWVLDNLQRQQLDARPNPRTLATHCALLWEYECIPDPFKNLGESIHPRSSSALSTSGDHQSSIASSTSTSSSRSSRCWGWKKNSETCSQLITIAFVLGVREILEDEIRTAVWGTSKKMNFAVDLGFDINAIRKKELEKLFDSVFYRLFEMNDENEKLAKSIRDTLKRCHLGNFSKRWALNATALEEWTPHDFLRGMENALSAPEPEQRKAKAPAGPPDLPQINWSNLVRTAMKATFPIATGKQSGGDQDKKDAILDELERLVDVRRQELVLELMTERNMKVQSWQEELDWLERNCAILSPDSIGPEVDETVVEGGKITADEEPCQMVPLNDTPHSTLGNNSHKEPIVQDDRYTDSGYHTRLNADTCSILSSDSIGSWPGLDPAILQDLLTNFTKIILENPSISVWAGAATITIPSDILEAKAALLLKEYSEELLPLTSSTPDAKITRDACLFIRRNRKRIARYFRENANKAPTRIFFDQSKITDEMSLDEKMENWDEKMKNCDIFSDHIQQSPDAVSEISDDSNEEFPIEFSKAREFLTSSPPFERLIDRLQGLYYDKGAKMLEIQTLVLSNMSVDAGSDGLTKACFQVSWDLAKFMATQYGHGNDVKLGSVITISGSALYCQALTAQDYLRQNWPTYGLQVLELLQSALGNKKFSAQALNIDTGLSISVDLTTPSVVEIVGSLDYIVAVAQIITWFGAAFQSFDTSKDVQYSESIITPTTTRNSFLIKYVQTPLADAERICWLPLFNNPVIAKGFPISTRGNREVGIEIPLEMMAFLSGAEHAVEYSRGLLIKSFSGMLVPVQRQEDSVQWHFLSDPTGRHMRYSDLRGLCPRRLSLDELDHDSLGKTRAFLAWWRASKSYLGTQNVSYENIGRSEARPTSMKVKVTDVTIGFSKGGGASTKFAMGLKDRHRYNSRAGRLERVLDAAQNMHTCIYDSTSKRSWLVSGTETLLHLVQTKHRKKPYCVNGRQVTLDFANPACDGPGACRAALMDMASVPLYSNTAICSNDYCVKDLVYELWNSLEAIEKPDEDAGITFSLKLRKSLKGYEMMDLVDDVGVRRQKEVVFKSPSGGWINMIDACYGIVLFGSDFGELIKPISDTKGLCSSWVSLPEGENYLAMTTQKLSQIFGKTDEEGHLTLLNSTGALKLHKASLMFENCPGQLGKRCDCERTQQIVCTSRLSFKSINPPMYVGDTGCIILGLRTRNVLWSPRSRSQTGIFSFPNHNILKERPRDFLEDLTEYDPKGSACFTVNSNPKEIISTSVCEKRSDTENGDELTPFPISDVWPFNPHAVHPQQKQCSMSLLDERKSAHIQRSGKVEEVVLFQLGQENLHSTPEISTNRRQTAGCDVGYADLRPDKAAKLSDTGSLSSVDRSYQSSSISPASPGSTSSTAKESGPKEQ